MSESELKKWKQPEIKTNQQNLTRATASKREEN